MCFDLSRIEYIGWKLSEAVMLPWKRGDISQSNILPTNTPHLLLPHLIFKLFTHQYSPTQIFSYHFSCRCSCYSFVKFFLTPSHW